jgi:hypothetical protein
VSEIPGTAGPAAPDGPRLSPDELRGLFLFAACAVFGAIASVRA